MIAVLDRTAYLHLAAYSILIIAFILFLVMQKYLLSFENLESKIIIINVLLAVGVVIEIGHFTYTTYKKSKKLEEQSDKNKSENDKEINNKTKKDN